MKKFFAFILLLFLSVGISYFAYANESEEHRYIFVTSCGKTGEIIVTGILSQEEENQWWKAFDELLCQQTEDNGDNNDIRP